MTEQEIEKIITSGKPFILKHTHHRDIEIEYIYLKSNQFVFEESCSKDYMLSCATITELIDNINQKLSILMDWFEDDINNKVDIIKPKKSDGEIIWDALYKYPIIIVNSNGLMSYEKDNHKLIVTYLFSGNVSEFIIRSKIDMIYYWNKHQYSLVDYFELDSNQSIKINNDICECDFYKQILPYGCNCGGK